MTNPSSRICLPATPAPASLRSCRYRSDPFAPPGLFSLLLLPLALPAAPQNILVLGDSLSEEYAFELPFSAPNSDPLNANIRNWIEILAATRGAEISFGNYEEGFGYYLDYRNGGHAFNWAVPGFKTTDLVELINPRLFPRDELELLDSVSSPKIKNHLKNDVSWVVIFCSGNDLSSLYPKLATGTATAAALAGIRDNLAATITWVRAQNAALRIVLVNAPDIGVTPSVQDRVPDPALRVVATAGIASLNTLLATLASERNIALADLFTLTRLLDGPGPLLLNGTAFIKTGDPSMENGPQYLFAKDGFHASTAAQALVANAILQALNNHYAAGFTPLTNREILAAALGLNPDQPFLDWIAAAGLPAGSSPADDPDHDGIPLLTELALGLSPDQFDLAPWSATPSPQSGGALRFTYPVDQSGGYAQTIPEWSTDLGTEWHPVTTEWISTGPALRGVTIPGSVGPRAFVRLRFQPAP